LTSSYPLSARAGGKGLRLYLDSCVLIYALEGFGRFRTHNLQQLEHPQITAPVDRSVHGHDVGPAGST
jgi:hypothetical protein